MIECQSQPRSPAEAEILGWLSEAGVQSVFVPKEYTALDKADEGVIRTFKLSDSSPRSWSAELSFDCENGIGLGVKHEDFGEVYLWGFWPCKVPVDVVEEILSTIFSGETEVAFNILWGSDFGARFLELPEDVLRRIESRFSKIRHLNVRARRRYRWFGKRIDLACSDRLQLVPISHRET